MASVSTGQWIKFKDSATQSCLVPCSITVKVFLGQSLLRATQGCFENRPFNRFWFTNDVISQVTAGCKIPKVDNFYTKMLLHIKYILLFSRKTPWTITSCSCMTLNEACILSCTDNSHTFFQNYLGLTLIDLSIIKINLSSIDCNPEILHFKLYDI